MPPVRELGQLVGDRLPLHDPVQPRVLERDRRLGRERLRERARALVEAPARGPELQRDLLGASSSPSSSLSGRPVAARRPLRRVTRPFCKHTPAGRAGGLHRRVEDHGQQPVRVVRRRERVADERHGVLVPL